MRVDETGKAFEASSILGPAHSLMARQVTAWVRRENISR